MRLAWPAFRDLPEYSATMPTGTTPGKMWRRLDGDFDLDFKAKGGQPRWMIGQYDPNCPDDAKTIRTFWYRPIIMLHAEIPYVTMKPGMVVPARYGSVDRKLRQDIIDWLEARGGRAIMRRWTGNSILQFYRRDDAFEFKMRFL
jgi:hypothetical protein